jgi:hypothetical protein
MLEVHSATEGTGLDNKKRYRYISMYICIDIIDSLDGGKYKL